MILAENPFACLFFFLIVLKSFLFATDFLLNTDNFEKLQNIVSPIKQIPFEEVITLGSCCLPKFRIQSFLKSGRNTHNVSNSGYMFDWMVPLNYTTFGDAVKKDLVNVFDINSVKPQRSFWDKWYNLLHNDEYKLQFSHAFDNIKNVNSKNLFETFYTHYHLIEEKNKYLIQKSIQGFKTSKRVLYVSLATKTLSDHRGQRQEDFINFINAIKTKRNNNFFFLILVSDEMVEYNNYVFDKIIDENVCFHKIKFFPFKEWDNEESIKQWDKIFDLLLN